MNVQIAIAMMSLPTHDRITSGMGNTAQDPWMFVFMAGMQQLQ
jgi:hypothetical protein